MAGQLNAAAIAVILTRATEVVRSLDGTYNMSSGEIIDDLRRRDYGSAGHKQEGISMESLADLIEAMCDGGVDPFAPEFKRPDG